MDLVDDFPAFDLYNDEWPIRGVQPLSGPAKFVFSDRAQGRVGEAHDSIVGTSSVCR